MEKELLSQYCKNGLTQRQISQKTGVSHTTIRYWLKKHNLSTRKRLFLKAWEEGRFRNLCLTCDSIGSLLEELGVSKCSFNYRKAKFYADDLGVSLPIYVPKVVNNRTRRGINYDMAMELFVKGTNVAGQRLRAYMVKCFGIADRCVGCGTPPVWMGKPITLHVDHIDGNHSNNELSNLQIVCPNCHSQRPTSHRKKTQIRVSTLAPNK